MSGVGVRLLIAGVCVIVAVPLLFSALVRRRRWRLRERQLDRAQAWWDQAHAGPFDQTRPGVPEHLASLIGPDGPRTDLRRPTPALAHLVWGWLLIALAGLLALTALAQTSAGLS